jgi:hypothetical protein
MKRLFFRFFTQAIVFITSNAYRISTSVHRTASSKSIIEVFMGEESPVPREPLFCSTRNIKYFFQAIPLPLYGLKSGEYKYTLNGEYQGVFNLPIPSIGYAFL